MKDNKELLIESMVKHCENLVRESGNSIFHEGVMHKESLHYAKNPSIAGLLMAALMRHLGYGPDREITPEDDQITDFYCKLNTLWEDWSVYPALNGEVYGSMAIWDTARLMRLNKAGFRYIDVKLTLLWIQQELTGKLTFVDDNVELGVATEVGKEIISRLNDIFLPEHAAAKAAKEARLAAPAKNVAQEPETEQPDRVAQLLVEPKKEVVEEAPKDEFDISALGNLDLDSAASRVEEMRQGGGEVVEASDECEGGACKI